MKFKKKLNLLIFPSILIPVIFVITINFIISSIKISEMQYELLISNVQYILDKCETKYAVIKALGMENVDYYQNATKQQILEEIEDTVSSRKTIVIVDTRTKEILFTTETEEEGLTSDQNILKNIIDARSGQLEYSLNSGSGKRIKKMAAFGIYQNWNWLVISNIEKKQVFRFLYNARTISIFVISLFLFIIFISIYIITKRISITLETLTQGTQRISKNDFDVEINITENNEFGKLAQNFNIMAIEIKNTHHDLRAAIEKSNRVNIELDKSLKWNEVLLSSIPDLLFTIDSSGIFLDCKADDESLLLPKEMLIGKNLVDVMPTDIVNKTMTAISKTLGDGSIQTFDYYINTQNKHQWFESRNIRLTENTVLSIARNITERRKAEEALIENEELLRVTLNSIGDAVVATDISGKITLMNGVAEKLTGWSYEDAYGQSLPAVFNIINAKTRKVAENPADKVLATGSIIGLANHTVLIARDGKESQIADSGSPIRSVTGEILGVVLVFRDVTEEYAIQEQLRQSQKLDAVGQLAGGVAHDFNNVLSGIMGAAQLLQMPKRNLDEKGIKYVDMILQASIRATDLIGKLLAFGRKAEIFLIPMDLHKILDDTVGILNRTIDKKVVTTLIKNAKKSIVIGDHSALENILINLGINASHAMESGGVIQISTENIHLSQSYCDSSVFVIKTGDYCKISLTDSGMGIPAENIQKIFEPFFTTKGQGKGTGLGLAAVYGIIKDHFGEIIVESKVGIGTSFYILLPCSEEPVEKKQKEKQIFSKGLSNLKTILLVDDEEINRILGKEILETLGYKVLLAENGQEAAEIFKNKHAGIDLVLMDMTMPKMNGSESFFIMKKIDINCKVIISSGNSKTENIEELIESGLAGLIHKPYRISELSKILDDLLNNQE